MENESSKIMGRFNFRIPSVIPGFAEGEDAKALYDEVSKTIKSGVWYDESSRTMRGSHLFLSAKVDSILRPWGIRVATLADLNRQEVMKMIRERFYSDTPAIVFRSTDDDYGPNQLLIKQLIPLVEEKAGRLELPCLVSGFDVDSLEDLEGYGYKIVPRDDFSVLRDERLSGENNGKRFSSVDKIGLPIFDSRGTRTWYAFNGLSGLCLYGSLDLGSGNVALADSSGGGRVVLIRAEGAAQE